MEYLKKYKEFESMIHQNSVDQLRRVSKELGNIDIGKRVSDDSFSNALGDTKRNIVDTKIETYSDYMKTPFQVNQNIKSWDERSNLSK